MDQERGQTSNLLLGEGKRILWDRLVNRVNKKHTRTQREVRKSRAILACTADTVRILCTLQHSGGLMLEPVYSSSKHKPATEVNP